MRSILFATAIALAPASAEAKGSEWTRIVGAGEELEGLTISASVSVRFTRVWTSSRAWDSASLRLRAPSRWCGLDLPAEQHVIVSANWPIRPFRSIPGRYLTLSSWKGPRLKGPLVRPDLIDVECAEPKKGPPAPHVLRGVLDAPLPWRGFRIPAGTGVGWFPLRVGGGIASFTLPRDAAWTINRVKVPGGVRVSFQPDGKWAWLHLDAWNAPPVTIEIEGVSCLLRAGRPIEFAADGTLDLCELAGSGELFRRK